MSRGSHWYFAAWLWGQFLSTIHSYGVRKAQIHIRLSFASIIQVFRRSNRFSTSSLAQRLWALIHAAHAHFCYIDLYLHHGAAWHTASQQRRVWFSTMTMTYFLQNIFDAHNGALIIMPLLLSISHVKYRLSPGVTCQCRIYIASNYYIHIGSKDLSLIRYIYVIFADTYAFIALIWLITVPYVRQRTYIWDVPLSYTFRRDFFGHLRDMDFLHFLWFRDRIDRWYHNIGDVDFRFLFIVLLLATLAIVIFSHVSLMILSFKSFH